MATQAEAKGLLSGAEGPGPSPAPQTLEGVRTLTSLTLRWLLAHCPRPGSLALEDAVQALESEGLGWKRLAQLCLPLAPPSPGTSSLKSATEPSTTHHAAAQSTMPTLPLRWGPKQDEGLLAPRSHSSTSTQQSQENHSQLHLTLPAQPVADASSCPRQAQKTLCSQGEDPSSSRARLPPPPPPPLLPRFPRLRLPRPPEPYCCC